MKSNFIKYIFIFICAILLIFAIYTKTKEDADTKKNMQSATTIEKTENISYDLRLAIVSFDTMNPILSKNKNVQDISKLIFDSLLTLDENYKIKNSLAEEWSLTGDTSYIIKLKEGIKWQDGVNLTAKDVQFTIDRLKEVNSIYSYNVQHVIGVDVIDDNTIRINLDSQVPFFEYNLTFPILAKHYFQKDDGTIEFGNAEKNKTLIGTGMYKITSAASNHINLSKNTEYWDNEEETKIETITLNLYSNMGEVYNAFKLGNLDLITTQSLSLNDYIGTIGFNEKSYVGREYDFIALNCGSTILSNIEVRKAILYSIDKTNILASVYGGKYYNTSFPLDYGSWLYNESGSSGYNPDQAKQTLLDAGWEYKYKNWQKRIDGITRKLNINLVVNSSNANRVKIAEIIKNNLFNVGIKVNLIKANDKQYDSYLTNKNYDLIITGKNVSISPNLSTYFGENNLANYYNEEVKEILNEIRSITDEELLKEKYKRLSEIYKNDVPYISLFNNRNTVIYSSYLIGDVNPNFYNIFYNIKKWYRQY